MNAVIKNLYENIINLLYEPQCPFEAESACSMNAFCSPSDTQGKLCNFCFNEFVDLNIPPRSDLAGIEKVFSCAEYKNNFKTIIKKLKWTNPKLASPIAELIHYKLTSVAPFLNFDCVVPVPALPDEETAGAPSVLLAKELAKMYKKPLYEPLKKIKETNLHRLSKTERQEHIKGAYGLHADFQGDLKDSRKITSDTNISSIAPKTFLLVDDIVTTGITLSSCAKLIKSLNPQNIVYAVTYASVTST